MASLGQATFPVKVRLFEEVAEVRPGMAAVVRLRLDDTDERPRAMIPAVAVGEDTHGRYVFVAEDDGPDRGVVERRAVEVGDLTAGGELEIFDGLVDGDRVVIRGMSKLQHGMAILLPESGAAD